MVIGLGGDHAGSRVRQTRQPIGWLGAMGDLDYSERRPRGRRESLPSNGGAAMVRDALVSDMVGSSHENEAVAAWPSGPRTRSGRGAGGMNRGR